MENSQQTPPRFSVLCVDDEPEILETLSSVVQGMGFTALTARSAAEAMGHVQEHEPRLLLVISDFQMPEMTGFDLRAQMMAQYKHLPFVIFSGNITREEALRAVELQITGFAAKPLSLENLRKLIEQHSAERLQALRDEMELIQAFVADVEGLTEELESLLLSLQAHPADLETVNRIFAIAHTIKGSSGFFSSKTLHKFTHAFEDYLSPYKKNATAIPEEALSVLLQGLDIIRSLLGPLKEGQPAPVPLEKLTAIFRPVGAVAAAGKGTASQGDAKAALSSAPRDDIKVPIKVLDQFTELSGEITVIRNMLNKLVRSIEKDVPGNRDVSLLSELLDEMHKINGQMQEKVVDLRKVSCKNIFRPLHRAVRDLAGNLKKDVSFKVHGEDLRVDTSIAEILNNSLIHMVRNSMDHGLESREARAAAGKEQAGSIVIEARELNQEIVVTIRDDGKGIDTEVIRKKAVEKGLYAPADAAKLSKKELYNVLFESGFSTAAVVTDVSGRGVGMDMVRKTVTGGGGRIEIESEPGKGSAFRLCIPIPKTVTIINSLLIRSGGQLLSIPQDNLKRLISFSAEKSGQLVRTTEGADFLLLEEELLPILNLNAALEGRAREQFRVPPGLAELNLAIVSCDSGEFAVLVDEIHDAEDTVVKKLGSHLKSIRAFQGATFLGDGRVGLILDVAGCAAHTDIFRNKAQQNRKGPGSGEQQERNAGQAGRDLLLFELGHPGLYGIFLEDIFRLEKIPRAETQLSGGQLVTIYRQKTCPIFRVENLLRYSAAAQDSGTAEDLPALILSAGQHHVALAVKRIVDLAHASAELDPTLADRKGVSGALIHDDRTITLLHAGQILELIGESGVNIAPAQPPPGDDSPPFPGNVIPLVKAA